MSIPINHHFVSRVLSNKFISKDGLIYKYNKDNEYQKIQSKSSTKGIFASKYLNSKLDESGIIDHKSLEDELNIFFENDFNLHYDVIVSAISDTVEIGKVHPKSKEIMSAIKYLIGLGLIGKARHPNAINKRQNDVIGVLMNISHLFEDNLKNEFSNWYYKRKDLKSKIPLSFKKLREEIEKTMGEISYSIQVAPDHCYFVLPDCSAASQRFRGEDSLLDGELLYNPSETIGLVMMPINSKILITATSERLIPAELKRYGNGIHHISKELVLSNNEIMLDSCFGEVICENESYLRKLTNQ